MLSEEIIKDARRQPQTFEYRIKNRLVTLDDQEEALKDPETAYLFAYYIPDADIERCQEVALKKYLSAFYFANFIIGADKEKCLNACSKLKMY